MNKNSWFALASIVCSLLCLLLLPGNFSSYNVFLSWIWLAMLLLVAGFVLFSVALVGFFRQQSADIFSKLARIIFILYGACFFTGIIIYQAGYTETTILMSAGEGARVSLDRAQPALKAFFSNKLNSSTAVLIQGNKIKEQALKKAAAAGGEARYKILADAEARLAAVYIENESTAYNIPLLEPQKAFYQNSTLYLDLFLKRFQHSRTGGQIDLAEWQRVFDYFILFIAGRSFTLRVNPDQADMFSVDRVALQVDNQFKQVVRYDASSRLGATRQKTALEGTKIEAGDNNLRLNRLISLAQKAGRQFDMVSLPEDIVQAEEARYKVNWAIPVSGPTQGRGYVETGFFNTDNEWTNLEAPVFILGGQKENNQKAGKALAQLLTNIQLMGSFTLWRGYYEYIYKIGVFIIALWLMLYFLPMFVRRLNEKIEPS